MKRLWPILLVLLFLNCRPSGWAEIAPIRTVEVRLENGTWANSRLYIMQGGWSLIAGLAPATGRSVRKVRIPGTGTPIRFFARFIAGAETWLSPELNWIYQGACVVVRLENNLVFSSVLPCRDEDV